jgi:2-methylcitrate dehydratase PrpD
VAANEIESITAYLPAFLLDMMPYHEPQTGLQAKYSLEYDLAAIALDAKAGMKQYTDDAVRRPVAQDLMKRISYVGVQPQDGQIALESRVVLKLVGGEEIEQTVNTSLGTPADPLTREEVLEKFHECSEDVLSEQQRDTVIELCERIDSLDTLGDLADVIGNLQMASQGGRRGIE